MTTALQMPGIDTPFNAAPIADNPWAFDCTMITAGPGNPGGKYYYPLEWINDPLTAKLYNGAQCFIDHDGFMDMENRPERSVRDLLGYWSNVRAENDALKGTLNIIPSEANEVFRDQIAASIDYRKQFPDKNLSGFSVVQTGDWEPFDFQGDTWKKVKKTNSVKSCDYVTLPARGGQAEAPADQEASRQRAIEWAKESIRTSVGWMQESGQSATAFAKYTLPNKGTESESKETESDGLAVITALRDKVAAMPEDAPMKNELRRGLDQALTAYQKNSEGGKPMGKPVDDGTTTQHIKTKPGMTVAIQHAPDGGTTVPTAEPDGDEQAMGEEAQRCEEAAKHFQKMSEESKESEAKSGYSKQAEAFQKMAESKRQKMAEAKAKKESEEAEEDESEEGEEAEEQESLRTMASEQLMRESEIPSHIADYLRKQFKGQKLSARKKLIEDAKGTLMRESTTVVAPPRQVVRANSANKGELTSVLKEC